MNGDDCKLIGVRANCSLEGIEDGVFRELHVRRTPGHRKAIDSFDSKLSLVNPVTINANQEQFENLLVGDFHFQTESVRIREQDLVNCDLRTGFSELVIPAKRESRQ